MSSEMKEFKSKSFWQRPEGVAGTIGLAALVVGGGFVLYKALPFLVSMASNLVALTAMILVLAAIVYMAVDPKMRNLIWYMYKSVMRWITGIFVTIDPIGVLKSYISELRSNLKKMNKQIGQLRGQMHQLQELIKKNQKEIKNNLAMANKAKQTNQQNMMVLKARKAGRLKESNLKLDDLYRKMEVLYRVLVKMYENSEIMLEDVDDQVRVKEQERKAIRASHSAMKSAANIIAGNSDKRVIFDQALEAIADDVSNKVGEMERFMELSSNFMNSVDLQNGVFEEEGLEMLERWEKEGVSFLLGDDKDSILNQAGNDAEVLDLDEPLKVKQKRSDNQYDSFFNS